MVILVSRGSIMITNLVEAFALGPGVPPFASPPMAFKIGAPGSPLYQCTSYLLQSSTIERSGLPVAIVLPTASPSP